LAIILFAQLAAVLAGNPYRAFSLLGETGVIDNPKRSILNADLRLNPLPHLIEQDLVRPVRLGNKMVQRLVLRTHAHGVGVCRQRFNTLSIYGQHQSMAVIFQTAMAINMPKTFAQKLKIPFEFAKFAHMAP